MTSWSQMDPPGWMIAVAPADPAEMDALMDAEAYAAKSEEEA